MNQLRQPFSELSPEVYKGLVQASIALEKSELGNALVELVYLRVSQINGCAFCIDRHVAEARRGGEDERRLSTLQVWRDTPFFSERERSALAWAEALTRISDAHVPDALWERVDQVFAPSQLIDLTLAINAANSWNRFAIAFRKLPS